VEAVSAVAAKEAVATAYAEEWGRIVAALIRLTGDWDLAEECAQDAIETALVRWPRDGVPRRPGAWLMTAARNRAIDRLRRSARESVKLRELAAQERPDDYPERYDELELPDDRLQLIFTCCHPALSLDARVALTLRSLGGLTTAEIARAFLVSERVMGQRLFRAKSKIRHAGIPFRVPPEHLWAERTADVLAVLYLLFNEGYSATSGADLVRTGLTAEAIRLTRILAGLLPDEPEAQGLLALMLLHDARRDARQDAEGVLVPLEEQDRSQWNHPQIEAAVSTLDDALAIGRFGPYQVQAAIAACHATAATAAQTDWEQIALLYQRLGELAPSPVVDLNTAVAVAMTRGPAAGLSLVDDLEARGVLAGYHLVPATRADLLRRLGRFDEARLAYAQAREIAGTDAERRYLSRRLDQLG
jgi:RNA polymerase sigma-70 factor (ECF subfamily)